MTEGPIGLAQAHRSSGLLKHESRRGRRRSRHPDTRHRPPDQRSKSLLAKGFKREHRVACTNLKASWVSKATRIKLIKKDGKIRS